MSKWTFALLVGSIMVAVAWYSLSHAADQVVQNALKRDGFTEVKLTGERLARGQFKVMGFEAVDKWGNRCRGYVANEEGGIVRVEHRIRPTTVAAE